MFLCIWWFFTETEFIKHKMEEKRVSGNSQVQTLSNGYLDLDLDWPCFGGGFDFCWDF